ncbi:predicted protein [Nematostella vectensis]|uniref:Uncharacterized protein n=1 Tax=Nematostella vectensis TaxID=45351 RepID=A7RKJ3_NEMVE|nr:predicted protein [Nematostella vectensis]|eukprot:XP_001640059.1 predicted protein [Nematostella vectensis]
MSLLCILWYCYNNIEIRCVKKQSFVACKSRCLLLMISDVSEIDQCIKEAESRIEMALHYGTAYPRMINVPPAAIAKSGTHQRKVQDRIRQQAKPTYLHSYEEIEK